MQLVAQKTCMLVVEKEGSTLSTLHRITNCAKNGTRKGVSSTDISISLAAVSPTPTFGQV